MSDTIPYFREGRPPARDSPTTNSHFGTAANLISQFGNPLVKGLYFNNSLQLPDPIPNINSPPMSHFAFAKCYNDLRIE
jgi:hypothetical protein